MSSAAGKAILCGEHAVVYGVPALAIGLEQGVRASAQPGKSELCISGKLCTKGEDAERAYSQLCAALEAPPCTARLTSYMPHGVGLGASAAMGVALARALLQVIDPSSQPDDPRILRAANAWEVTFHGNASGVDVACAFHGGAIRFAKAEPVRSLRIAKAFDACIVVAGPASATKEKVASVAAIRQRNPRQFEQTLEAIATLVTNIELSLGAGDLRSLGQLLNYNQMLLSSWFLSTPELETACRLARDAGALGAKLTGAGGGGCVLAVTNYDESEPVLNAWRASGLECFSRTVEAG